MLINKIIAVEGIDKTGKTTLVERFNEIWNTLPIKNNENLIKYSFPNNNNPIGKLIRDSITDNTKNDNTLQNFLSEFSYFWMNEQYNRNENIPTTNKIFNNKTSDEQGSYIFDRYLLSTLAYQVFFENNKFNLNYFNAALLNNKFIKLPTDIVYLDIPSDLIIERTRLDLENGLNDLNDTLDISIIEKRKDSFKRALTFLDKHTNIHYFENASLYNTDDLIKILMGKIFK